MSNVRGDMKAWRTRVQTAKAPSDLRSPSANHARPSLNPSYYKDLESFRRALESNTLDESKGCRDMNEYYWSLKHV